MADPGGCPYFHLLPEEYDIPMGLEPVNLVAHHRKYTNILEFCDLRYLLLGNFIFQWINLT